MNSRTFLILIIATTAPAAVAFADDGPDTTPKAQDNARPTAAEFAPMTRSERFRNYLGGLVSAQAVLSSAATAGIRQAENSPKEWRGGAEGFGYRIGDAFAKHVIRRTLQYGASAALHEDNRYFLSGQTGFFRRAKYALVSTLLARHDNGRQFISFSRLGSAAGGAFISRTWQPHSENSAEDAAANFGIAMGTDAGFNVIREFWPDLKRRFRR
jgi:hypothetical protein